MTRAGLRAIFLFPAAVMALGASPAPSHSAPAASAKAPGEDMARLLDYVRSQNTTGFLVMRHGRVLVERNWPAPQGDTQFALFTYERNQRGELLEDVASQQKSFVSVLISIAIDKGLIDMSKRVSDYIGAGWSRATPAQEAQIRVIDLLTMSSGLDEKFGYSAAAGSVFLYNTPVYAVTKRILTAAVGQPLDVITRDWLTAPLGMKDTSWRKRPAALASIGNDTGLVASPADIARFGRMILRGGVADDGRRLISEASFRAMLSPSATNPAYGRLWWLNGSAWHVRPLAGRADGPLVPAAPHDMVAALGAFDRKLYIVPSEDLIVVRTGAGAKDKDFDQQLWLRLINVIARAPSRATSPRPAP